MSKMQYVQYSFRLNLENPKHLEIHQTLVELNRDIHKSKSNFIINCLSDMIHIRNSEEAATFTETKKSSGISKEEFITEITDTVRQQVMEEVTRLVLSALAYRPVLEAGMYQTQKPGRETGTAADTEEFDPALVEMADLYGE